MKFTNGNFKEKSLKLKILAKTGGELSMETKDFASVYEEIAVAAGAETAVAIHKLFKGQQILFPQKLYKKDFIYDYIRQNYNGKNVRELSQKFGYSDRRIRQILSDLSKRD